MGNKTKQMRSVDSAAEAGQKDIVRRLADAEGRLAEMERLRDDLAMRLDTAMEALENCMDVDGLSEKQK